MGMATAMNKLARQDDLQKWDQQPGEGPQAFTAFAAYRDLDPSERAIRLAYKRLSGDPEARVPSHWWQWSNIYEWIDRSRAWDAWIDKQRQYQRRKDREALGERKLKIGRLMQGIGMAKLRTLSEDPDLIARSISHAEAVRYIQAGLEIETEALGGKDSTGETIEIVETFVERIRRLRRERGLD